jgi:hypothetical protein
LWKGQRVKKEEISGANVEADQKDKKDDTVEVNKKQCRQP